MILDADQKDGQFRRWFNDVGDRIEEAKGKGYRPVLDEFYGLPVRRLVGIQLNGQPQYAVLMQKPVLERYLPEKWLSHRSPAVRARIRRLNPRLTEGQKPRGWHPSPTLREMEMLCQLYSKRKFIGEFGRQAWNDLPPWAISKWGKRTYVAQMAVVERRHMKDSKSHDPVISFSKP